MGLVLSILKVVAPLGNTAIFVPFTRRAKESFFLSTLPLSSPTFNQHLLEPRPNQWCDYLFHAALSFGFLG